MWIFKARFIIIAIVIIWTGIAGWRAALITPLTKDEDFLPEDHWITKAANLISTGFNQGGSEEGVRVSLVWGLKDLDKSEVSRWDPKHPGDIVFDDKFSIAPV